MSERIIDKLRKLNAKAENLKGLGSEAEAQVFAEAVQRMLADYKLSMTDVQFEEHKKTEPVGDHIVNWEEHNIRERRTRILWIERLSAIIAQAHQCRILVMPGTSRIIIVGRESDRKVAEYVMVTLVRSAESIADKEYVKFFYKCKDEGDVTRARGFRESFLMGFVSRIQKRYMDARAAMGNDSTALIRFDTKEVENYIAGKKPAAQLTRTNSNHAGYIRGQQVANSISLTANAMETNKLRGQIS